MEKNLEEGEDPSLPFMQYTNIRVIPPYLNFPANNPSSSYVFSILL